MSDSPEDLLSSSHLTPSTHPSHPYSSWPSLPPHPLGRIKLLTPEVTLAAARSSLLTGRRFTLDHPVYPSVDLLYGGPATQHFVKRVDDGPTNLTEGHKDQETGGKGFAPCFDDFLMMNSQCATQWDYFLHYAYYGSGLLYGGLSAEEVQGEYTGDIGMGDAGGIQTRAILLDIPYYLASHDLPPLDPLSFPSSTVIDLDLLQNVMEFLNLTVQVGDVLIVRTGFEAIIQDKRAEIKAKGTWAGVRQSDALVKWIWESGFVAVCSDNPTFEEWYPEPPQFTLHPILLSGMGIMIGELFRLEAVAEECKRLGRWHFYFTSQPLNIKSGIGSPPNAVAIF